MHFNELFLGVPYRVGLYVTIFFVFYLFHCLIKYVTIIVNVIKLNIKKTQKRISTTIPNVCYKFEFTLMFKMACSRHHHSHIICITIINTQLVFYRTSRLNYRCNTSIFCNFNTIWKWEKSITCHGCTS